MFKSKNMFMFVFMQLQDLSPCEVVLEWLRTCDMAMEVIVQILLLTSYECD